MNVIPNDQKISRKAHLFDELNFAVEAFFVGFERLF